MKKEKKKTIKKLKKKKKRMQTQAKNSRQIRNHQLNKEQEIFSIFKEEINWSAEKGKKQMGNKSN